MNQKEKGMKIRLDALHDAWNRREYVSPDPLETLYDYEDPRDREVVGMVASSLAYGRVAQILISVRRVLGFMGPSPCGWLVSRESVEIEAACAGFVHRFTKDVHMAALLTGIREAILTHGSLKSCFLAGYSPEDETLLPALSHYVKAVKGDRLIPGHLLSDPDGKSACKKANLFLRWMVRCDEVDPGGWHEALPASKLIIPIDTHMHKISLALGFTTRKAADLKTAVEVTRHLARLNSEDPTRYDFCLTRFGIRGELNIEDLL
ncbi:TIGR02757 family protein [Desulfoluna sp.]|uniref:TIGR02757 family protein n=1 Tax=Desulfoluna sp. TaxID=2045199 RepID=UPI00260D61EC|nr:TIGR02757 family protein [Desulfoluna sp.]